MQSERKWNLDPTHA